MILMRSFACLIKSAGYCPQAISIALRNSTGTKRILHGKKKPRRSINTGTSTPICYQVLLHLLFCKAYKNFACNYLDLQPSKSYLRTSEAREGTETDLRLRCTYGDF